jgi:DNA-binding SARP family transcriptional activator
VRLQITLAGDVTVARGDGDDRQAVAGPPRIVLAALVLERAGPLARDRLAGIVWPEAMPRTWASALRTYVSRARPALTRVLGAAGEAITASEAGYQLALPPDVEVVVDIEVAAARLAAARAALAADPARALDEARAAGALVRAPFLAGHGGAWADDVRARLDDLAVSALLVAGEAATAVGDGTAAVAAAEEATQRAPLHEAAHRALMAAHDAAGNRAEALRAYQRARRLLADELGVDPSAETEAAYLSLLGPAPPTRAPRPAGRAVPPAGGDAGAAGGRPPVPFVGRAVELGVLTTAWEQASQGARHVVVITGEAGIGKSRLASEAALRVAAAGGQVLFGRCDQEAIVPYQPLVEALDGLVATTPADELPSLGPAAAAELAAILPGIGGTPPPSPPDRGRLFAAVTDLVAALARARPLLLVLDDLQWADDDTLLLLRHLLRRAGSAPVLVVAISRDHDLDPGSALADVVHALDRDGWVRRLPLRGLGEADVRRLLSHLLGAGDHRAAARHIAAETAGNPFLVTELGLSTDAGGPGGEIPQSVHDLVTARLGRLDAPVVDLLQAAAVGGARFDLDVAGAAAGLDGNAALDAVDAALRTGLIAEETADRYHFIHDIVRRTLVARLGGARQRALHRRTADAVERLRSGDLDAHAAVLAHHAAAGADPGGDRRAVLWARRASAEAARRRAPAEAVRLCRQALAHVPPGDGALLADATTELGAAELAAGEPGGAVTLADGAALAHRHGRPEVLGRAALALADAAEDHPDHRPAARELVDVALAAGSTGADHVGGDAESVLRARLFVRRLRLGSSAGGLAIPDGAALLAALHRRTAALAGPAHLDERRVLADELATLADAVGDPRFAVLAAHHQAMAAAEAGDDTVVDKALAVLEDAARRGDAFAAAMLAERAVASLTAEGHVDEARTALDAALVAVRAAAAAGTARDAAEPAPAPGSDDVPIASESPAGDLLPLDPPEAMAARHRVVLDWLAGDDPARGLLTGPAPDGAARLHALAVDALAATAGRRPAAVAEVRAALAPYADRTCGVGYRSFAGAASFHLGRLAAAAGDWADAERHLQAALRHHTVLRARPWVALTQRALAEVLEARGRTSDREWIAGLRSEADHVTSTLGLRAD